MGVVTDDACRPGRGTPIGDPANDVFVSATSIWGDLRQARAGPRRPQRREGVCLGAEALRISTTPGARRWTSPGRRRRGRGAPSLHRDPFPDRLPLAQALTIPFRLLTHDPRVANYEHVRHLASGMFWYPPRRNGGTARGSPPALPARTNRAWNAGKAEQHCARWWQPGPRAGARHYFQRRAAVEQREDAVSGIVTQTQADEHQYGRAEFAHRHALALSPRLERGKQSGRMMKGVHRHLLPGSPPTPAKEV